MNLATVVSTDIVSIFVSWLLALLRFEKEEGSVVGNYLAN